MKKISAVIFDMDGVVSDTQGICSEVESALVGEYGVSLTPEEITKTYSGVASAVMFPDMFAKAGVPMPNLDALMTERRCRIDSAMRAGVRAVPGTIEWIHWLHERRVPMAIGSASHPDFIRLVLSELGVLDRFSALCSSYEVERGKPDPALFLLAAQRIHTDPATCLVVEDGISGMTAARSAGMSCIALTRRTDIPDGLVDVQVDTLLSDEINQRFEF